MEYKPKLNNLFSEEELKETEKSGFQGCKLCDAGYVDGHLCECLRFEIMNRKYQNANIDYDFASLPIYDEEVEAYLKTETDKLKINLNKFSDMYVTNSDENMKTGNGFLLNGPTGRGKSLTAMKTLMKLTDKGYKCYFTTIKQFLDIIKKSWDDEEFKTLLNYVYNCDFLVVDDLGTELHKTDWTITEIDSLFRHRYFKRKPTIMTTNSSVNDLKEKYAQRIVSLFHERLMFIAVVSKEDFREKSAKVPSYMDLEGLKDEL
jgi:DNA replication protein DnaC